MLGTLGNLNQNKNPKFSIPKRQSRFKNLNSEEVKRALDEELDLISKNDYIKEVKNPILSSIRREEKTYQKISRSEQILSQNKEFIIDVISPENNYSSYNFHYSKEGKYYIISEKNSTFQIKLTDNRKFKKYFGSTLFIDGKEIQKVKTCFKNGTYFGFKQGNGKYNSFQFIEPDLDMENFNLKGRKNSNISDDSEDSESETEYDRDYYNKFGTIEIKFYDTMKVESNGFEREFSDFKDYKPNKREVNKKFVLRNQTVRKGEEFFVPNNFNHEIFYDESLGKYMEPKILFDKEIDSITLYYQDFLAMNILGLVRLRIYLNKIKIKLNSFYLN